MPYTNNYKCLPGLVAGADLSGSQFKIVKLATTAGQVVLAASSVLTQAFVLMNQPYTGEAAEVAYEGIVKVQAGTAVTLGAILGVNTTSRVAGHTTDNRFSIGKALEAATANGDIIAAVLIPGGVRY